MLDAWIAMAGWERLLNRSGTTFRKMVPEAEREAVDGARARELMLAHPSMVRRPVLAFEGRLLVGFDARAYEQAFDTAG
jgi:arsenate reductase